ncbi:uncharacterized protein PITG_23118 [Phytophthora infestans T30-4]|uniref:HAT C-terminal dimerisation domain-containing protein n=1 Tax=Phytophthora infestans (strain T30-4) TaxID=403677 RepID=D0NXF8_PHYIT|nr:uncharacterized protein PITG_23118 [Phytophthora infestans T30-4]EEY67758.1 conserved hypothetical protein [Phytophthora infestans T30-4]|eukprot:XP_002997920.1 conserved hypothetical protein [Phytophthora infestans T30-4]
MPRSKLPDLALVILSIAVNTATCERYFSELALIHTAKRNRMSPDKARKLALVRKKVREYNAGQDDAKTSSKYTRLIDPTERTRLRYRDDRFECLEPEVDAEDGNVVGPDTAFEYWQAVLCELEDDDDPPVFDTTAAADNTGSPLAAAAASLAEEKRFAAVLETIKIQSTDPIPEGDRRPFPRHNDRLFPQEQRFPGLRGQKVTLAELSKTPSTPLAQPGRFVIALTNFNKVTHSLLHAQYGTSQVHSHFGAVSKCPLSSQLINAARRRASHQSRRLPAHLQSTEQPSNHPSIPCELYLLQLLLWPELLQIK